MNHVLLLREKCTTDASLTGPKENNISKQLQLSQVGLLTQMPSQKELKRATLYEKCIRYQRPCLQELLLRAIEAIAKDT